jgi:threonine dehydrogenase-like Zn-dependent dehydrogenase
MKSRAMVQVGPRKFEAMEVDIPAVHDGEGLLRVESCGLCGSDIAQYHGNMRTTFPIIPGHEPIGIVEEISAEAARNWGVKQGDRVALMPHLTCGRCEYCLAGNHHLCRGTMPVVPMVHYGYGSTPLTYGHGLWGGYAEYIHLHPRTLLCKVPEQMPLGIAAMYQAFAAGLRWAVHVPHTTASDTVLVMGAGQRGLASVVALKSVGVETLIVTGLARDAFKLDHARRLGASHIINVEQESTLERIMEITGGRGVDIVIDVASGSPQTFVDAVECVRLGGTIVVAAVKSKGATAAFNPTRLQQKEIRVQGVFTQGFGFYQSAFDLLARYQDQVASLHTHDVPLRDVSRAIEMLGGEIAGEEPIYMTVRPDFG